MRLEEKQRAVRRQREAEQELASQEGREYTGNTSKDHIRGNAQALFMWWLWWWVVGGIILAN